MIHRALQGIERIRYKAGRSSGTCADGDADRRLGSWALSRGIHASLFVAMLVWLGRALVTFRSSTVMKVTSNSLGLNLGTLLSVPRIYEI